VVGPADALRGCTVLVSAGSSLAGTAGCCLVLQDGVDSARAVVVAGCAVAAASAVAVAAGDSAVPTASEAPKQHDGGPGLGAIAVGEVTTGLGAIAASEVTTGLGAIAAGEVTKAACLQ